jgi:predicted Co/Zn/Cd cation transporter (cation efflux family)
MRFLCPTSRNNEEVVSMSESSPTPAENERLPWYMTTSLATLTALALPNFIGLATRTKIWCWLSGKCQFGAADMPSLVAGAVMSSLILGVEFYIVFQRKMKLVALIGGTFCLVFALTAFSIVMSVSNGGTNPHPLDAVSLAVLLFLGGAHLWWVVQRARTRTPSSLEERDGTSCPFFPPEP